MARLRTALGAARYPRARASREHIPPNSRAVADQHARRDRHTLAWLSRPARGQISRCRPQNLSENRPLTQETAAAAQIRTERREQREKPRKQRAPCLEVQPQAAKPHACPCTPQARGRRRSEALVVVGGGEDLRFSDTGVSPGSAEQQAAPPLWEQLMLCCCPRRAAAMTYTSLPQRCTHMFSTQMGAPPGRASSMPENDRQLHRGTSICGAKKRVAPARKWRGGVRGLTYR